MDGFFSRLARAVTDWTGSTVATVVAFLTVLLWALGGLVYFGFGDSWQLVINTGTTIVTFLMVFLIQRTQNKDNRAVQLKLNELVASSKDADNRLIDIESMSEAQVEQLYLRYHRLAKVVK